MNRKFYTMSSAMLIAYAVPEKILKKHNIMEFRKIK
jgi:hypothetical protein